MTLNQLASLIAKREGKKHQASIGDVREIIKILFKLGADGDLSGHYIHSRTHVHIVMSFTKADTKRKPKPKKKVGRK